MLNSPQSSSESSKFSDDSCMGRYKTGLKEAEEGSATTEGSNEINPPSEHDHERKGTAWTGAAHCTIAVIGAGTLALPHSVGALGWVGGPIIIAMFGVVSMYSSLLLCNVYRCPGPNFGHRNRNYMACVKSFLGKRQVAFAGVVQYALLVIIGIGYTVTAAVSMVTVRRAQCFHVGEPCKPFIWPYAMVFGGIQIIFSQIPDLHNLSIVSFVAAGLSISYIAIGLGLSIGKASEPNHDHGTAGGIPISVEGQAEKAFTIMAALGQTACAFMSSCVLIEIQDTIKAVGFPPTERYEMRKASLTAIGIASAVYISVGCIGYAGFGNQVPSNLLTGFGFYNPWWLVSLANVFVVVNLIGTWQVISQPFFAFVEERAHRAYPSHALLHHGFQVYIPGLGHQRFSYFKLVWRSAYVGVTTIVAALLPFFGSVVGIIGSLGYWPMSIYFPTEMHIAQQQLPATSSKAIMLRCLNGIFFIVALAGIIGNVDGLITEIKSQGYIAFGNVYEGK